MTTSSKTQFLSIFALCCLLHIGQHLLACPFMVIHWQPCLRISHLYATVHIQSCRGAGKGRLFLHLFVIISKTFPSRSWADFYLHPVDKNFYHIHIPVLIIGKGHGITTIGLCSLPFSNWGYGVSPVSGHMRAQGGTRNREGMTSSQVACVRHQSVSFKIATVGTRIAPELKTYTFPPYCGVWLPH